MADNEYDVGHNYDDGYGDDNDQGNEGGPPGMPPGMGAFPLGGVLGSIFGGIMGGPSQEEQKANRAAYEKAKETGIRIGASLLQDKRYHTQSFSDAIAEHFWKPLRDNPLVKRSEYLKLAKALADKTGGKVEIRPGVPPRDESFTDVLIDAYYAHVCEHVGWLFWNQLPGPVEKKEEQLEELLPILEKYGSTLLASITKLTEKGEDDRNPLLKHASGCAARHARELLVDKAREMKLFANL